MKILPFSLIFQFSSNLPTLLIVSTIGNLNRFFATIVYFTRKRIDNTGMKNEWIAKVGSQQQDVKHLGLKAAPRTAMSGRGGVAGGMGCLGKSFVGNSDKVYGAVGDGWMDFFYRLRDIPARKKRTGGEIGRYVGI